MTKREHINAILSEIIQVSILLCDYNKSLTKDAEKRKKLNKYRKICLKASEQLYHFKHDEVVYSIYKNVVVGKEALFTMCPSLINHKASKYFDTDKGFKEFLKLEEQSAIEEKKAQEEILKKQKSIENAKKDGGKLDFVMKNGKLEPVIVKEEKK